jgi:hypothetical protein
VHVVDPTKYLGTIQPLRTMDPAVILSTHLPPATGPASEFLERLGTGRRFSNHANHAVGLQSHLQHDPQRILVVCNQAAWPLVSHYGSRADDRRR